MFKIFQNQVSFTEKSYVIDKPNGRIELDLLKSTNFYIKEPINNCFINLKDNYLQEIKNELVYIEYFVSIEPNSISSYSICFDSNIYWVPCVYPIFKLEQYTNLFFSFNSFDNGKHWNGNFIGSFKVDGN